MKAFLAHIRRILPEREVLPPGSRVARSAPLETVLAHQRCLSHERGDPPRSSASSDKFDPTRIVANGPQRWPEPAPRQARATRASDFVAVPRRVGRLPPRPRQRPRLGVGPRVSRSGRPRRHRLVDRNRMGPAPHHVLWFKRLPERRRRSSRPRHLRLATDALVRSIRAGTAGAGGGRGGLTDAAAGGLLGEVAGAAR